MRRRSPSRPRPLPWSSSIVIRLPRSGYPCGLRPQGNDDRTGTRISLFLDIGQGAGLAGASGVRPFLPPLLAGALAGGDIGLDFDGTAADFLEAPWFLFAVLAVAVGAYALERSGAARGGAERRGSPLELALGLLGALLGALLFAGSLAAGGNTGWPGLFAGAACATLGWLAAAALFGGARRRLDDSAGGLLVVYADLIALALAAAAIFVPPLGLVAVAAFVWLLVSQRRRGSQKFAGLRILR